MELEDKKEEKKSNYEMQEVENVELMDRELLKAAAYGDNNLAANVINDDDREGFHGSKFGELKANKKYFLRKTESKNNILHLSVQYQNIEFSVKAATKYPELISEVNDDENNSLHFAAEIGNVDFVKLLVGLHEENMNDEKSQPWMRKNKEGNTPLHVALIYGKIDLACYFVNLDPQLVRICNHSDEAPLHLAIRHRVDNDRKVVGDVMKLVRHERMTIQQIKRYVKLERSSESIVKLLLQKDPSIACCRDDKGLTPPLIAATLTPPYLDGIYNIFQHCHESSDKFDSSGNNILHLMTKYDDCTDTDVIILLNCPPTNALKNKQNNAGNTPAHIAIQNHNVDLIGVLILSSANLAIKNKEGVSAADLIQQSSHEFRTLIKNKTREVENDVNLLYNYRSIESVETIREIGFSVERIKESHKLHKITAYGNILCTLLNKYPYDMEDNKVKKFMKQILEMAPILICQQNNEGQNALHLIARQHPSLIDQNFQEMIESCYEQVTQDDDVAGVCYNPPWIVKDKNGNTILHLALSNHWPGSWMQQILQFEPELCSEVNGKGEYPLHVLVRTVSNPDNKRKYADIVEFDLEDSLYDLYWRYPELINSTDEDGLTPLLIAARAKDLDCFNILVDNHRCGEKQGFKICDLKLTYEGDPDGNMCWHYFVNSQVPDDDNNIETMQMYTCSHVRNALTQMNKSGKTAFHLAIENGNFKVAKMFSKILQGIRSREWKSSHLVGDEDGNVPLHVVVGRSNLPYARQFIECITPSTELIRVQNKKGITPLHLAVLKKDIDFLNILFDLKRDDKAITREILQITDMDHNTPLHYALSKGGLLQFGDILFNEGVSAENIDEILGMSNKDGNSPLHLATMEGYDSLVRKFIGTTKEKEFIQGMLEQHNNEGNTALHLSVLKRKRDIAEIFIKTAKENKFIEVILGKRNNEGNTALHLAIQNRDFELVKRFIEYAIEDSCINQILDIRNNRDETSASLIGSAVHIPREFESFFWNEPKVVEAMLGVRSLIGVPTKMIKESTNTIGVIAALLATITFTAGFTVPGGLSSNSGTPLLMRKPSFKVFMVSDIIAMCLSMMVLFFLVWIMTIKTERDQVILLDLTVFSLQGAFYATVLTFMTGLYASVFPSTRWIAIFACVLCSLLLLLVRKHLIIWIICYMPGFIRIYVWFQRVYTRIKKLCCCNQNNGEPNEISSHANEPTEHSQTIVNIEPNK